VFADFEVNTRLSGFLRTTSLKVEKNPIFFENSVGSFLQNISHRCCSLECIAGTEAMFADLGHFAVSSIQVGTGSQSLYTAMPQLVFSSLIHMTTASNIVLSQDFSSLLLMVIGSIGFAALLHVSGIPLPVASIHRAGGIHHQTPRPRVCHVLQVHTKSAISLTNTMHKLPYKPRFLVVNTWRYLLFMTFFKAVG
jgi:hypothetical protein